jgi:hypothetical protein
LAKIKLFKTNLSKVFFLWRKKAILHDEAIKKREQKENGEAREFASNANGEPSSDFDRGRHKSCALSRKIKVSWAECASSRSKT